MCADMDAIVETYPGRDTLSRALAGRVAAAAREAVAARGRFMLAIPGGSVLTRLAEGWAGQEETGDGWQVFWTDERCVPPDDPRSNVHAAQAEWFGPLGLSRVQLHPGDGTLGPEAAAAACEADLARAFGLAAGDLPVFDLILLGLGEDGHVASLFPGHPALEAADRTVAPVVQAPKPPPERITLTLPVLNHARHLLVAAAGDSKADILARVLCAEAGLPPLPAQRLRPAAGELRWMLDAAAASRLPPSLSTPHALWKDSP